MERNKILGNVKVQLVDSFCFACQLQYDSEIFKSHQCQPPPISHYFHDHDYTSMDGLVEIKQENEDDDYFSDSDHNFPQEDDEGHYKIQENNQGNSRSHVSSTKTNDILHKKTENYNNSKNPQPSQQQMNNESKENENPTTSHSKIKPCMNSSGQINMICTICKQNFTSLKQLHDHLKIRLVLKENVQIEKKSSSMCKKVPLVNKLETSSTMTTVKSMQNNSSLVVLNNSNSSPVHESILASIEIDDENTNNNNNNPPSPILNDNEIDIPHTVNILKSYPPSKKRPQIIIKRKLPPGKKKKNRKVGVNDPHLKCDKCQQNIRKNITSFIQHQKSQHWKAIVNGAANTIILEDGSSVTVYSTSTLEKMREEAKANPEMYQENPIIVKRLPRQKPYNINKVRNQQQKKSKKTKNNSKLEPTLKSSKAKVKICESKENESSTHICEHCGKIFYKLSNLKTHIRTVHGSPRLPKLMCEICGKKLYTLHSLKYHILTHSDLTPEVCTICSRRFRRPDHLKRHMFIHLSSNGKPFKCQVEGCESAFTLPATLKNHIKVRHEGIKTKTRKCPWEGCNFCTDRKSNMDVHYRRHTGLYVCKESGCGATFTDKDQRKVHSTSHPASLLHHPCTLCDRSFKSKSVLKIHEAMKHIIDPVKCSVEGCDKTFANKSRLRMHKYMYHNSKKLWSCRYCQETFKSWSSKKLHEMYHNRIREFKCSHCIYSYAKESALKTHITIIHQKKRKLQCKPKKTMKRNQVEEEEEEEDEHEIEMTSKEDETD